MKAMLKRKYILMIPMVIAFAFLALTVYAEQGGLRFKLTEVQIPKYFEPAQWNSDGWIYGTMSDKFLKFQPETGAWKVLQSNVWNGITDENGKVLAFRNAKGLQYVDLTKTDSPILIDNHPAGVPHFWSPDGRYLLYSHEAEWKPEYFIFDRVKAESTPYVFENVENFLSEPLAWKKFNGKDQILFLLRFSKSKTGESAYRSTGYRGEFYLANSRGQFAPLVQVQDGEFPVFDGVSADGLKVFYHFYNKKEQIWEIDLMTSKTSARWTIPNIKRMNIAGDRGVALIQRNSLELFSLRKNEVMHTFSYEYTRVIWSADHSKALVLPSQDSKVTKGFLVQLN